VKNPQSIASIGLDESKKFPPKSDKNDKKADIKKAKQDKSKDKTKGEKDKSACCTLF